MSSGWEKNNPIFSCKMQSAYSFLQKLHPLQTGLKAVLQMCDIFWFPNSKIKKLISQFQMQYACSFPHKLWHGQKGFIDVVQICNIVQYAIYLLTYLEMAAGPTRIKSCAANL